MVRVRLTPAARALLLVALGCLLVTAGVFVLAGLGWALLAAGLSAVGVGLLSDVDEKKKEARR